MSYPDGMEIDELLKRMKAVCSSHAECNGCPLYDENYSLCNFFENPPEEWDIEDTEE